MFGIVIAFEDYNPMSGLWHSDFVGMENFAYLFSMSDCKRVIINTLVIAVAKLILNIIVPLAFALLLNEIRQVKFKKAVQTIVYLPHFLSWVILASVLLEMFGYKGVINSILGVFGIQGKIWFSEENCFRQLVIGSDVWKEFGFNAVIYLAALTGISPGFTKRQRLTAAAAGKQYGISPFRVLQKHHRCIKYSWPWKCFKCRLRSGLQSVQPAGFIQQEISLIPGLPHGSSERTVLAGNSGGSL